MKSPFKVALASAAAFLVAAAPAQGAVTIGSSLATPNNMDNTPGCNIACTVVNLDLNAANQATGGLRSPVNGTVTSWRLNANAAPNVALRVLRPGTGTTMTGVATSAAAAFAGPGTSPPIPTNLPIQAGDAVGLESPNGNFVFGTNGAASTLVWNMPVLANGSSRMSDTVGASREVLVQAVVEPTNTLTIGAATLNKKKGTAVLSVTSPNPGQLTATANGGTVTPLGVGNAIPRGEVKFTVRATGKKAKKLKKKGKAGISATFNYTPTGGTASSQTVSVGLKRTLKKKS